jgi:hypothetical protein
VECHPTVSAKESVNSGEIKGTYLPIGKELREDKD